jgi:hypothetical protein
VKSKFVRKSEVNGKEHSDLIESEFRARNKTTGKTSDLSVMYGTRGPISKIPVRITYKPRWWLSAELLLDESAGFAQAALGGDGK